MAPASDPVTASRFRVEIDGLVARDFVEVLFPEAAMTAGHQQLTTLVLRRGASADAELADWWKQAAAGTSAPRNLSVFVIDASGAPQIRWNFTRAEPVRYTLSGLNALEPAVLVETIELQVESF